MKTREWIWLSVFVTVVIWAIYILSGERALDDNRQAETARAVEYEAAAQAAADLAKLEQNALEDSKRRAAEHAELMERLTTEPTHIKVAREAIDLLTEKHAAENEIAEARARTILMEAGISEE